MGLDWTQLHEYDVSFIPIVFKSLTQGHTAQCNTDMIGLVSSSHPFENGDRVHGGLFDASKVNTTCGQVQGRNYIKMKVLYVSVHSRHGGYKKTRHTAAVLYYILVLLHDALVRIPFSPFDTAATSLRGQNVWN